MDATNDFVSEYQQLKAAHAERQQNYHSMMGVKYQEPIDQINEKYAPITLFTIRATPSSSCHMEHTVGLFSSHEEATRKIPSAGYSIDTDNGVRWYYKVEPKCVGAITAEEMESLNRTPGYFPYTGW
jgi:hypothetical protein